MKINNNFNNNKFGGPEGIAGHSKGPERIKIDPKCPVCGSIYDFGRLDVIQEEDTATLMYIKCSVCQSATLSLIAFGGFGLKIASAITDLERDEVMSFQDNQSLRSEDVLSLYEELNTNNDFINQLI